jgi:hypothetical protein
VASHCSVQNLRWTQRSSQFRIIAHSGCQGTGRTRRPLTITALVRIATTRDSVNIDLLRYSRFQESCIGLYSSLSNCAIRCGTR